MSDDSTGPPQAPRGPGRPRSVGTAEKPGNSVSTWVPAHVHDALIKRANRKGQSVSETVRELLSKRAQ
jgi:hypothetical protein